MDIGQDLFFCCVFVDQDAVGDHRHAKKKPGKCLHDQKLERASFHDQIVILSRDTVGNPERAR